jgi:ankyrin repeat protein
MSILEECASGNIEMVRYLLNEGENIHIPMMDGNDRLTLPLVIAVTYNRVEIVRLLLDHGVMISPQFNRTILLFSRVNQNYNDYPHSMNFLEMNRLLLEYGANPNVTRDNETPLHFAAIDDNIEIVRLLLDNGANPNLGDSWKIALELNRLDILQLLLDRQPPAPAEPEANPEENLRVAKTTCAICSEPKNYNITDVNSPLIVHSLPCGHTYHNVCINRWLTERRNNGLVLECPICRAPGDRSARIMLGGFYNKLQKYVNKLSR